MGGKVRRYAQSLLSAVVYCTLRCTARVALLVNQWCLFKKVKSVLECRK